MKRLSFAALTLVALLLFTQQAWQLSDSAARATVPQLHYLGEGGTFTVGPGQHFIVKSLAPFVFRTEPGPTYAAAPNERVWSAGVNAPAPVTPGTWLDFGRVPADCAITYTVIDDDVDHRVNVFYVDDTAVHEIPQGMVTSAAFTTTSAGTLRLFAADSIGIWLDKCAAPEETPTVTAEATMTPTGTVGPSLTPTATEEPTPAGAETPVPPVVTEEPTVTITPTKRWRLPACLRINFEVSGGEALEGIYEVREVGGRLLYTWYAQAGWRDSGWIHGIDISFENVYIEVFYVPESGPPIRLEIMNPAPGTHYGWLSWGVCHSLEVGWPDPDVTPTATPDAHDGYNDEFDRELLDLLRYIWPGIDPTPSPTPASSLRG
jgi:hypothetical protein